MQDFHKFLIVRSQSSLILDQWSMIIQYVIFQVVSVVDVPEEVCDLNPIETCRYATKLVRFSRTSLLLKFCDKSYQLLLILQGASPKPGPWVHHRAQGGDIWTRQNAFLGNYDTDIDRGATSSASFVLKKEVVSLFIIHLKVCQLKFTPPVQVQKPLLTKWCLDATPSVSWFLSPFVLMFFYRTQVRL